MPDEQQGTTEQRDAEQPAQTTDETPQDGAPDDLGDKGREALRREREARKSAEKERADLRRRLDEIESRQREATEAKAREEGKFKDLLDAREKELADLRADLARRELTEKRRAVARKYELPDDLADRLVGDTDEDMDADAKRLAKLFAREDGPDTDSGKRSATGTGSKKSTSLLATYEFGKRR